MPAPTIAETLKFANLQMAAESLFGFVAPKVDPNQPPPVLVPGQTTNGAIGVANLTTGNLHASKFAATEATQFAAQWTVVEHISNTTTGFSGTLFKAIKDDLANGIKKDELVLSFRSTEFIDDAARDNEATNKLEIADKGWAFGQIDDMEQWYATLSRAGGPLAGKHYSVTGYSLAGHLATAFNQLRQQEGATARATLDQVVTFNGAGVGRIDAGYTLKQVIDDFHTLRTTPGTIDAALNDAALVAVVREIRTNLDSGAWTIAQAKGAVNALAGGPNPRALTTDELRVWTALDRMETIVGEAVDAPALNSGSTEPGVPANPAAIPLSQIEQTRFDYQMAVLLAARHTKAVGLIGNTAQTFFGRSFAGTRLANQYDVMGATEPSAVANSQLHYGADVKVFMEDQPLQRGGVWSDALARSMSYWDVKLLVNGYTQKDFGDTHSLVLMVDSLSVQQALVQLLPTADQGTAVLKLNAIFEAASALKAASNSGQGKAEGNVSENVVNDTHWRQTA